jgi:UDP-N-acetylglucosamine diphosphorylase / glucose-1-phosphate thymidylyltransferase / UDP-N-acetylgalactosamine diphosphorylase / glucosamine-1-phosphate N-acetyltransferase / galactosamine-1-phosphate N-acetyltransferase
LRRARSADRLQSMFAAGDLFNLAETEHAALFDGCGHAWEALPRLGDYLKGRLKPGLRNRCDGVAWIGDKVSIGEGTVLEDGVMIQGPAIIGRNCVIRHNAYIRGNVLVGDNCVVGNASELKQALLFNGAQVPHFNYVGDSILGHRVHLGAGVKISNFKLDGSNVLVDVDGKAVDTGLRKVGALIGDRSDIGCNAVLNPGSILGRNTVLYPNVNWRGVLPADRIVKNRASLDVVIRRSSGGV